MSILKLNGSSSGNAQVTVAAAAGTPTITLPTASIDFSSAGSDGQYLQTNGSGTLSFSSVNPPHAWANFTLAGSHSITAGEGFSSITDDSAGVSILTLSTALSSTDDVCVVGNQILVSTGSETWILVDPSCISTTQIRVDCRTVDNDAPSMVNTDATRAMIIVMTTP